jgi:hypothetical protein
MKPAPQILVAVSLSAVLISGCARRETYRPTSYERYVYVEEAPPAPRVEERAVPPGADYVWRDGYWEWRDNQWVWVSGEWVARPGPTSVWVSGRWERHGHRYYWIPGHWRR